MKKFIKETKDEKRGVIERRVFIERISFASPKKDLPQWTKGNFYCVVVNVMSTGKLCIYKELGNYFIKDQDNVDIATDYKEPGYRVYSDMQALKEDFETQLDTREVDRSEIKIPKSNTFNFKV